MFSKDQSKDEVKPRGRPRKEQRRRKSGIHGRGRQKLTAPSINGYYTRWCTDQGTRLHDLTTTDDYDFVTRNEINDQVGEAGDGNSDLGAKVRVLVDEDKSGAIFQYLMKKKIEYHKEDLAETENMRREKESTLRRGSDSIENQYGSISSK